MQLTFFNAYDINTIKATVYGCGRLGFSRNAEKQLALHNVKSFRIAAEGNYSESKTLLLVPDQSKKQENFAVVRSGPFYYVNTRNLMAILNEDYESKKIVFDIIPGAADGQPIFKLKRRNLERKR